MQLGVSVISGENRSKVRVKGLRKRAGVSLAGTLSMPDRPVTVAKKVMLSPVSVNLFVCLLPVLCFKQLHRLSQNSVERWHTGHG